MEIKTSQAQLYGQAKDVSAVHGFAMLLALCELNFYSFL